ncbi:phage portal protein [Mesorhizobium koreense]|uniref:phage portal protein n=1 Tax=Mesorhizobium koreense TaxID=3074855 RepID=UPI00287BBAA4|nr:phage portal protein [Mesorhizobium sp. WR6]
MKVPAVRLAVTLISEMVGALPCKVYDAATKEAAKDHPTYRLIHDEPNSFTGAEEFRAALTRDALLTGYGYAFVNRVDGRPIELLRLDPNAVTTQYDTATGEPFFTVPAKGGGTITYTHDDIMRIRAPGGCSPIVHGREAIALALVMEQWASKLFGNGARPSGLLMSEKALGDDAKAKIAASWNAKFGPGGSGGTAVLDEKMDWRAITLNSTDAQFIESRRFQIGEIARLFGVPVTMLQDLSAGIKSNVEEQNLQFLTDTLAPWLSIWSRAYGRALFSPSERGRFYCEFTTDALLVADTAARATAYGQYRSMGVMTANEVRAGLNLPAHPDGDTLENPYTTTGTMPAKEAA